MLEKPIIGSQSRRDSRFVIPDRGFGRPGWRLKVGKIRNLAVTAAALALVTAALVGLGWPAQAQDYPSRPIRVLIAFPPGGPTDFVGRLLADKMSALLGQRVYIENKAGANGTVGADNIAKSDPDGYSLFLTTAGAVTISPHVMASLPYDSLRDFVPIAEVVTNTMALVVGPKMAIKTAKELVALAKQKPGAISLPPPGSARRRTLRRCSSPMPQASASSMCLIAAPRRC
jgi:tripartite-type tricarboxylate transporter receptor subunit TctC